MLRVISIHALRVEGDATGLRISDCLALNFYPRPPGGGRPHFSSSARSSYSDFYPRPPGGGRHPLLSFANEPRYFYPRPPGGGRRLYNNYRYPLTQISIHALRVEGDDLLLRPDELTCDFYPRPPGGGRPKRSSFSRICTVFLSTPSGWRATISSKKHTATKCNFYPRPPGGGRQTCDKQIY